ncbi:hypothetical protein MTR67_023662 [Solanum verrucosum]|uniref:Uncharacterized protein n=1 Tax=Solanum verrucosum TaxID=315347 RepID=A0AAF0TRL4_SOLVR|nr:hypothetical protein MTR67_023662 [Solanum verrucosum]
MEGFGFYGRAQLLYIHLRSKNSSFTAN